MANNNLWNDFLEFQADWIWLWTRDSFNSFLEWRKDIVLNSLKEKEAFVKTTLVSILRDWYWIKNKKNYKELKNLIDKNHISINLPEELVITEESRELEHYVLFWKNNKIVAVNPEWIEVWSINNNSYEEAYYWERFYLENVFYRS